MSGTRPSFAQRAYRLLLRLFPIDFRAEFGHEMEGVFLDEHHEATRKRGHGARARLWLRTFAGVLRTAPAQHADVLRQDLTYAGRTLARTPAFTVTAVLALALGIGASCAVFNLVHGVVLKRLPVASPERLAYFSAPSFSYPILREVERRVPSLDGVFGWTVDRHNVNWGASPEAVDVLKATSGIHAVLGIRPSLGRLLRASDDARGEAVAVISHTAWQQRFGGDPGVLGRTVRVEHTPVTIVGVTPRGFFGVAPGLAPEITVPATLAPRLRPDDAAILERPGQAWLHIMGRIKDGLSLAQADAALQVVWPQVLETTTPTDIPADRRARYLGRQTHLMAGDTGFSRVRRQFEQPLWVLFALVLLLLAIGCGSVANMMLSRTLARGHELSVRRAIGAGRGRLLRQLLTEGLTLSMTGATLGVLLGVWGSKTLIALLSTTEDLITVDTTPDPQMLIAAAGLAVTVAIILTVTSAACALRADAGDALRAAPRSAGGSRAERRLGGLLVSAQVAVSLTLVAGASLFATNLHRLHAVPTGLDRAHLLIVHVDAVFAGYTGEALARIFETGRQRLAALPGVVSVSYSKVPPVSHDMGSWTRHIAIDGRSVDSGTETTFFNAISPAYFATTGTRLLAGRPFEPRDVPGAPPVVIVNATLVNRFLADRPPLGRRISVGRDTSRQDLTIVGVVEDAKYQWLQETPHATAYLPYMQTAAVVGDDNPVIEVRTQASPAALADSVRDALRRLDSGLPVRIETLDERIAESLVSERALAMLASALGITALALAAAALYGLMAYAVTVRTREFGVRVALGATPAAIRRLVLGDAARVAAIGTIVGMALAIALGRFVQTLLVAVAPTDAGALTAAAVLVVVVTVGSALVPARRSGRTSPSEALRST